MKYKPEISVVRKSPDDTWHTERASCGDNTRCGERALLVRGVPMVGERVMADNGTSGEVTGVIVRVMVTYRDGTAEWTFDAKKVSPAPHEGDVKRVRDALAGVGCDLLTDNEIRVAIRAMKEGER